MDMTERTLESREVYRGRILRVREDKVSLPNGKTGTREVVEHPGGVGILALDDDGCVVLVRQYRYAFSCVLTEIPAGKREKGEAPFVTAQRELKEEIGAEAEEWTDLGALIASPGCYGETLYLFLARGLHFGETHPDEDEFLDVLRVPFDRAVAQCLGRHAHRCQDGGGHPQGENPAGAVKKPCISAPFPLHCIYGRRCRREGENGL